MAETKTAPKPIRRDERTCFGLAFFTDEADADTYGEFVLNRGDRKNGGWFHGDPCGRDRGFDYTGADGTRFYAVTEA